MIENKVFERVDYKENYLGAGEYENCTFINCVFYNSDLSDISFNGCEFDSCDFSLAKTKNTVLDNVKFVNCKLLGLHFDECSDFVLSVDFENCLLEFSTFYRRKLKKTRFKNCKLREADFTEADLSNSTFDNCDLQRTVFSKTNLEKADFYSSFSYSIDPENNRIKKAKFSRSGILGLLDKYDIQID